MKSIATKLKQRDHTDSEIFTLLHKMLKYVQFKPPNSWLLQNLTKVDFHNDEMTIVSEFDFKMRLLYPELESIFVRSFETELLDNLDCLNDFISIEGEVLEPIVVLKAAVMDPGRVFMSKI